MKKSPLPPVKPRRALQYYTLQQWQEIIEDWKKSGLPERVYCKKKKLIFDTFSRWKKRVNSPHPVYFTEYKSRSLEEWKEIIEDWEKSGLSTHAYAIQKELCPATFHNWKKRINPPSVPSQAFPDFIKKPDLKPMVSLQDLFVPLTESSPPIDSSTSSQKIEVTFAQGHRLCLQGPFDWEDLSSWLTPLLTKKD